jgi:hypothetical protein
MKHLVGRPGTRCRGWVCMQATEESYEEPEPLRQPVTRWLLVSLTLRNVSYLVPDYTRNLDWLRLRLSAWTLHRA